MRCAPFITTFKRHKELRTDQIKSLFLMTQMHNKRGDRPLLNVGKIKVTIFESKTVSHFFKWHVKQAFLSFWGILILKWTIHLFCVFLVWMCRLENENWPIHLPNLDPKLDPYIYRRSKFAQILRIFCKIYVKLAQIWEIFSKISLK